MKRVFSGMGWASLVLISRPGAALAQQGYGPGYGGHMMNWWGWGSGYLGGLPMIILWIALIVGVIFLVKWMANSNRDQNQGRPRQDPLEILKIRYAKGEITKEEYEALKADLKG